MQKEEEYSPIPRDRSLTVVDQEEATKRKRKAFYYPQIKSIIETLGVWHFHCSDYCRKWDIPTTTMHRWKHQILDELAKQSMPQLAETLKITSIANIKMLQTLIRGDVDPRIKVIGAKVHAELIEKFTTFCERYGFKGVVPGTEDKKQITLAEAYEEYEEKESR